MADFQVDNTNNLFFSSSFGERELAAARGEGNDHEGEQVQPGFLGGKDTKVKSLESEDGMMVDQVGGGGPGAARSLGSRGSRQGSARSQAAEEGRGGGRPTNSFILSLNHISFCLPSISCKTILFISGINNGQTAVKG